MKQMHDARIEKSFNGSRQISPTTKKELQYLVEILKERSRFLKRSSHLWLACIGIVILGSVIFIGMSRRVLEDDVNRAQKATLGITQLSSRLAEIEEGIRISDEKFLVIRNDIREQLIKASDEWFFSRKNDLFTGDLVWASLKSVPPVAHGLKLIERPDTETGWAKQIPVPFDIAAGFVAEDKKVWVAGVESRIAEITNGKVIERYGVGLQKKNGGNGKVKYEGNLEDIYFLNNKYGWAVGSNTSILMTDNGGETWVPKSLVNNTKGSLYSVRSFSDGVVVAVGTRLIQSFDYGNAWMDHLGENDEFSKNIQEFPLYVANIYDDRVIVAGGKDGRIAFGIKEDEGGNKFIRWKWAKLDGVDLNGQNEDVKTIQSIVRFGAKSKHLVAVGNDGTILFSEDLGETWRNAGPPPDFGVLMNGSTKDFYSAVSETSDSVIIVGDGGRIFKATINHFAQGNRAALPLLWKRYDTEELPEAIYWVTESFNGGQTAVGKGGTIINRSNLSQLASKLNRLSNENLSEMLEEFSSRSISRAVKDNFIHLSDSLTRLSSTYKQLADQKKSVQTSLIEKEKLLENSLKETEQMLWLNGSRGLVIVVSFLVIRLLVSLYRYSMRLAAYYDARADALTLYAVLGVDLEQTIPLLSPDSLDFMKLTKEPMDHAVEIAKELFRATPKLGKDEKTA